MVALGVVLKVVLGVVPKVVLMVLTLDAGVVVVSAVICCSNHFSHADHSSIVLLGDDVLDVVEIVELGVEVVVLLVELAVGIKCMMYVCTFFCCCAHSSNSVHSSSALSKRLTVSLSDEFLVSASCSTFFNTWKRCSPSICSSTYSSA